MLLWCAAIVFILSSFFCLLLNAVMVCTDVYKCVTRCAIAVVKLKIYTISVRMYTLCRSHIRISDRVLPKCGTQDPWDSGLGTAARDSGFGTRELGTREFSNFQTVEG